MEDKYNVTHKGYTLVQVNNNHYSIFEDSTKRLVCHAQCTKKLTDAEKKEYIEYFLKTWGSING